VLIETRFSPDALAATHRGFAFYVAHPIPSIRVNSWLDFHGAAKPISWIENSLVAGFPRRDPHLPKILWFLSETSVISASSVVRIDSTGA